MLPTGTCRRKKKREADTALHFELASSTLRRRWAKWCISLGLEGILYSSGCTIGLQRSEYMPSQLKGIDLDGLDSYIGRHGSKRRVVETLWFADFNLANGTGSSRTKSQKLTIWRVIMGLEDMVALLQDQHTQELGPCGVLWAFNNQSHGPSRGLQIYGDLKTFMI